MQTLRSTSIKSARAFAIALFVLSCGSEPLKPTTINITTAGGQLSFLDGFVTVDVPAGAVERDTTISIRAAGGTPSSPRLIPGTPVELGPDGMTFLKPLTVAVDLGSRTLPTGFRASELRIHKVVNSEWQMVPGSVAGPTAGVVSAQISSFSTYGVLAVPVASLAVSGSSSLATGASTQLTATPRDANANALPDRPVTWSTSAGSIATVSNSGVVAGVSAGTATIKATSEGVEGTMVVTVSAGGTPGVWLEEDFSSYADITGFLANPRGIYSSLSAASEGNEVFGRNQFTLENTGYGSLTKSLRFNFPDRTGDTASRCQDYSIGVNLNLPASTSELWLEVVAQYSSNFTTRAPAAWQCTSNPDHKFLFGRVTPSGRFGLHSGTAGGQWTFGYPGNEDNEFGFATNPYDGQWHTYRIHMKTSAAGSGAARFWMDGVLLKSLVNVTTSGQSIYGIAIGRNLNQGPGAPQSLTIGRVRVWNTNPGF